MRNVEVDEIYSLDDDSLASLPPVYGVIFLFKWRADAPSRQPSSTSTEGIDDVYFASQVIDNACATQAVLSVVLNRPDLDIGDDLIHFKNFTADFPPALKGLAISNSDLLREVHNSFASDSFALDADLDLIRGSTGGGGVSAGATGKSNDTYHFISYVPVNNHVFELDGLSDGPVNVGTVADGASWLDVVLPVIKERISQHTQSEIRFNLMAVVKDRRAVAAQELQRLELVRAALMAHMLALREPPSAEPPVLPDLGPLADLAGNEARLVEAVSENEQQLTEQRKVLKAEEEREEAARLEGVRRKHNYYPFIIELIKILGAKGELAPLISRAKARAGKSALR